MKKLIISMFVLLTAAEGALAQGLLERYNVTNLDVQTGLPHNHVNGIFADSRGFIWISSYGGGSRTAVALYGFRATAVGRYVTTAILICGRT